MSVSPLLLIIYIFNIFFIPLRRILPLSMSAARLSDVDLPTVRSQ